MEQKYQIMMEYRYATKYDVDRYLGIPSASIFLTSPSPSQELGKARPKIPECHHATNFCRAIIRSDLKARNKDGMRCEAGWRRERPTTARR
jgi:hypothetical protein